MAPLTVAVAQGLWSYAEDARKRPHVHPLKTPKGAVLTRDAPPDHPWHHALWFTIKYVNEENFWEEQPPYGVLRHVGGVDVTPTSVAGALHWIRPDQESVAIVEKRTLQHVPLDDNAYALDWSTTLEPQSEVLLDRTPFTTWGGYGGLAFRGRNDWVDTRFLLDDGSEHQRMTGVPSRWCDLSGEVEGAVSGILFLDGPANPRHAVPWYGSTRAETYGDDGWSNFLNAAFLWDAPLVVGAGERLHFSYRMVVHDGPRDRKTCDADWQRWVAETAHGG